MTRGHTTSLRLDGAVLRGVSSFQWGGEVIRAARVRIAKINHVRYTSVEGKEGLEYGGNKGNYSQG